MAEEAKIICPVKHTVPQIPDDEWKCPKCGAGVDYKNPDTGHVEQGFIIQEPAEGSIDCPMLHEADEVGCDHCGWGASGKKLAAMYAKAKDLVPCPCCKGKGMVPSKKAKGWTLIELMIAVAILGIIVSIIVPHLSCMEEYRRCCPCSAEASP
jgi:prepilin-type N-terminal cleavage/methylation domain-containing protein